MAKTIPQLTDATTVNAADELIIQQGGVTKRATATELFSGTATVTSTGSSTGRALKDRFSDTVNARDFGAVGDGVTDDTAALQAALNSLGATGGCVLIDRSMKCVVNTTLIVPKSCCLLGAHELVGKPGTNSAAAYGDVGSAILLDSSATIQLGSSAGVAGLLIRRKGMTFPAADSSQFAGTALTTNGDDCYAVRCLILGFNRAVYAYNSQRPKFTDLNIDCQTGIEIELCYDVAKLVNIHCWPFSTVANAGFPSSAWYQKQWRTGSGFYIHDVADNPQLANCFAYGYANGFYFKNVAIIMPVNCFADNPPQSVVLRPNSVGWRFEGFINGCLASSCGAYSHELGLLFAPQTSFVQLSINNFYFADQHLAAIKLDNGIADITDCYITNNNSLTRYGVYITSADPDVRVDFNTFSSVSNPIHTTVSTVDVLVGASNFNVTNPTSSFVTGDVTSRNVLAATTMALNSYGSTFRVLGATNISGITGGWAGREVTLIFTEPLTVSNGTGSVSSVRLNSSANFTVAAGSTLTLKHNGIQWFEIGRCA